MKFQANSAKFTMNGNNSISGKSPTIFFLFLGCLTLWVMYSRSYFPFSYIWPLLEKEIDVGETFHYPTRFGPTQTQMDWKKKEYRARQLLWKVTWLCVLVFADSVTPRSKHPNHIRTYIFRPKCQILKEILHIFCRARKHNAAVI
jgi:hypothetical protein